MPDTAPPAVAPRQRRLVFRTPALALLGVLFLALAESWVALASPWLKLLYLIPLGWAGWIVLTRTVADDRRLVIRTVLGRREVAWPDVTSLRVRDRGWVHAVLTSGASVPLPCVRARHLPFLAAVSGGRLADPSAEPEPVQPASDDNGSPRRSAAGE